MQPKKPRFNPLVIAIVLAAVLMVWSVLGGTGGSANGSSLAYSTVVTLFEEQSGHKIHAGSEYRRAHHDPEGGRTGWLSPALPSEHHPVHGRTAVRYAVLLFRCPHRGGEEQ